MCVYLNDLIRVLTLFEEQGSRDGDLAGRGGGQTRGLNPRPS